MIVLLKYAFLHCRALSAYSEFSVPQKLIRLGLGILFRNLHKLSKKEISLYTPNVCEGAVS